MPAGTGKTASRWAWLFGQPRAAVTGRRYQAQSGRWEVNVPAEAALAEAAV